MRPPNATEFLVARDVERMQAEAAAGRERDRLLLGLVNVGLALNHESVSLSHNAQMVLALVALTPGIGVTMLAEKLFLTPGGASKILDQLSMGRMVRGERQSGLGLVQREPGQGCFLTKEGERIIALIVNALKLTR